ncbi:MAG: sigma-70 family RNA polymerase sigma factor [Sphingomonas sp.]|nr:sigma-70 family RNA polymerase sigma factor [Sphingomonas sp.]
MTGRGLLWPRLATSAGRRTDEARGNQEKADAFRRTMMPHMDAAYNLARYLTRDANAAEDIVQDAYLRAYRSFETWRGEAAKPWLLTIVRNCFLNSVGGATERLTGRPVHDYVGELPSELIETGTPESQLAEKNEAAMLRATIEQLPEPFRETLILRELEELSYKEIAAIARVPIGTIMSRLARARQMLADLLLPESVRKARS